MKLNYMKLNLGCGNDIKEGYLNCDIDNNIKYITHFDASKTFPIECNSISEIYCSHLLEHIINWEDTITECHRVLIPNGKLIIRVPYGCSKYNYDAYHKRFFWKKTMNKFIDTIFRLEKLEIYYMLWYHEEIRKYLKIKFFNEFKYKIPFGYRKEIKWQLIKI